MYIAGRWVPMELANTMLILWVVAVAVPEPSSWALLAFGLLLLAYIAGNRNLGRNPQRPAPWRAMAASN